MSYQALRSSTYDLPKNLKDPSPVTIPFRRKKAPKDAVLQQTDSRTFTGMVCIEKGTYVSHQTTAYPPNGVLLLVDDVN